MALQARLESTETYQDGRARVRRQLGLQTLASGLVEDSATVIIHNLSESGLLIETSAPLAKGDLIDVDLPNSGATQVKVIWSSDQLFGCEFVKEVSSGTVSAALLRAPFTPTVSGEHADSQLHGSTDDAAERLSPRARLFTVVALSLLAWSGVGAVAWLFLG
jgi:hypothetical protein